MTAVRLPRKGGCAIRQTKHVRVTKKKESVETRIESGAEEGLSMASRLDRSSTGWSAKGSKRAPSAGLDARQLSNSVVDIALAKEAVGADLTGLDEIRARVEHGRRLHDAALVIVLLERLAGGGQRRLGSIDRSELCRRA